MYPKLGVNTSALPEILGSAYEARHDLVLCLLGQPGIGKTQQLYQFAEKKGANVVEIIASQILPNEVSGITMPVSETHSMEIYDHARLSSLKDGDILFFDELLQASPQTLSACLTLIQERRLMSGKMLPDIMIVAAANELPSATMIPMQIRQRFLFVNVSWDSQSWREYNQRKYNIEIPDSLVNLINFRDKEYNTLTPRTMSKLLAWRAALGRDEAKVDAWGIAVASMFGRIAANAIAEVFAPEPAKRQLYDVFREVAGQVITCDENEDELGKIFRLDNAWDSLTIKEIYAKLQELKIWPEIKKAFEETELRR